MLEGLVALRLRLTAKRVHFLGDFPVDVAIAALAAIIPSLVLLWYFYHKDLNPEPRRVLLMTFCLGVFIVVPVVLVALPLLWLLQGRFTDPVAVGLVQAFVGAAIPEEFFKFVILVGYCARHKEFDEPMDGMVYGVVVSLGFATMENVLYVFQGGLTVAVARALTAVPGHAFLGAILGYYVGQARFRPAERVPLLVTGLGVVILLHGLYDFPLIAIHELVPEGQDVPEAMLGLVATLVVVALTVLIVEGVWAVGLVRRFRSLQLQAKASQLGEPKV